MSTMCKQCGEEHDLNPHCGGLKCDWVVCIVCEATTDLQSKDPDAFFEKKPRTTKGT